MRRVLITGSSGFIGRALACRLLADPEVEQVAGIDIVPPAIPHDRFKFFLHDVCVPLNPLLRALNIDTVIHAAFAVRLSHDVAGMWRTNVEGTRQVLRSACECGVRKLIHLSSATVYGFQAAGARPFRETQAFNPAHGFTYAEHKAETEELIEAAQEIPSVTVLRPSFIVGPRADNPLYEHITRRLVLLPSTLAPLQLTHVDDLTSIIQLAMNDSVRGPFNVAAPGSITAAEMVLRLKGTPLWMPGKILRIFNEVAWRARVHSLTKVPSSAVALLEKRWHVDSSALRDALGYRFSYMATEAFETFACDQRMQRHEHLSVGG